jgi:DNA-binding CsgD family transcriptional regulator
MVPNHRSECRKVPVKESPPASRQAIRHALGLSQQQFELLLHLLDDHKEFRIAREMGITVVTAHSYRKALYAKLGVHLAVELTVLVFAGHLRLLEAIPPR